MAGALKRVEQEMAALDQAVADLSAEMKSLYSNYLAILGPAAQRQLILACYRLCTQGYPEAFLRLGFTQRQQFQQALRQLGAETADRLIHLLNPTPNPSADLCEPNHPDPPDRPAALESGANDGSASPLDPHPNPGQHWDQEAMLSSLAAGMKAALEQAQTENRLPEGIDARELSAMMRAFFKQSQAAETTDSSPVEQLARWQKRQEAAIVEQLQRTSYQANRLLQRFNILHQHLPEQVFSAIARADAPEGSTHSPHILNLLVETKGQERPPEPDSNDKQPRSADSASIDEENLDEDEDDNEPGHRQPALTHLIAINLRLAEIEFIDPTVMSWRNKIRELTNRLKQLRRTYRKKQREWAIIEAEAAWRSSWVED